MNNFFNQKFFNFQVHQRQTERMRHRSEWFLSDPSTGLVTVKCRPSSMVMPIPPASPLDSTGPPSLPSSRPPPLPSSQPPTRMGRLSPNVSCDKMMMSITPGDHPSSPLPKSGPNSTPKGTQIQKLLLSLLSTFVYFQVNMPVSLMCAYAADSQTKINTAWSGAPRPRKTKKMGQNPPAVNPEKVATMPNPPRMVVVVATRPFWSAPLQPTPVPATVTINIIMLYWLARGQKRAVKELAQVLVLRRLVVHLTWSPVLCLEYKKTNFNSVFFDFNVISEQNDFIKTCALKGVRSIGRALQFFQF